MAMQAVLTVERQVIAWFEILDKNCCRKERFPVCVIEDDLGPFYAFPCFHEPGMKIGKFHHLYEPVEPPEAMKRHISHMDEQVDFFQEYKPWWFLYRKEIRPVLICNAENESIKLYLQGLPVYFQI